MAARHWRPRSQALLAAPKVMFVGLGPAAVAAIQPCVVHDVVFYPLIEAAADLIRRGVVSAIAPNA